MTTELQQYPVVNEEDVRWGDMDAIGHVNNTVYFRYFESARIRYDEVLQDREDAWPGGIGPIVASTSCDFKKPLEYPDRIRVGARVVELGEKKYVMDQAIYSEDHGGIAAEGRTVMVSYDYEADGTVPLPEGLRRAIEAVEDRVFE
jgi:acyl-CoA thioester hydrolase